LWRHHLTTNRFYTVTSIFLILVLGYLSYSILKPFLSAIAWAVVFSIIFYPVYVFLLRHVKFKVIGAMITLMLIILITIGPATSLSLILANEVRELIVTMDEGALDSMREGFNESKIILFIKHIGSYIGMERIDVGNILIENIKKIGKTLAISLPAGITNIAHMFIDFIFMLFTIFFLLKDGPGFLLKVKNYLPFGEKDKERLICKVKDMIISTVYGGVIVAIIQGLLGGIAFYFLGINMPALWGAAISVMSFLPILGTFSVWGPMSVYLFFQGNYAKGAVLFLFGALVISMVDNILRPLIISGRTKMPTLIVFFSVLGGIKFFGLIGFIMGPLVLAIFISVFELYRHLEGGEYVE
jgi:predicted PurR-regulated permease PerM